MAQPTVRVRIGFTQNTFTLDDLVRGVLDSAELAGATPLTDVTSDVQSVSISRGRSRDLDTFRTGSASAPVKEQFTIAFREYVLISLVKRVVGDRCKCSPSIRFCA